jgi:hypothetical protein
VPRADRYELTLFDHEGSILWEAQTPDTAALAPESIGLAPGTSYFWKVEAQVDFGRWSESDLVEFTPITPSGGTLR